MYRFYVADALQVLTENTAAPSGKYMAIRYCDLIKPSKEESRTAEEVIQHMKNVLGGGETQ